MFRIPLIRPYIPDASREGVMQVLQSGHLTEGSVARQLEQAVCDFVGCRRALAVCNCTVGLELALRALSIGPGDEVIVPDYTYPATADAVAIVGAVPVIVDIHHSTLLVDYDKIERAVTGRTKAVMPVSEFGNPLDYDRLNALKKRHNLYIIEDAACSLGSSFRGTMTGNLADVSVFSLHPRKFLTSGEGGLITTNHNALADCMGSYKHFGLRCENGRLSPVFERIGTNYKLSDILCSVALGQFQMIGELLEKRLQMAARYRNLLSDKPGIALPAVTGGGVHSYQTFSVLIEKRDAVMAAMRGMGIEVQIGTYALHREPAFREGAGIRYCGTFENSLQAYRNNLALPLFYGMSHAEQDTVVGELLRLCAE